MRKPKFLKDHFIHYHKNAKNTALDSTTKDCPLRSPKRLLPIKNLKTNEELLWDISETLYHRLFPNGIDPHTEIYIDRESSKFDTDNPTDFSGLKITLKKKDEEEK